jgi:hypothetical protein
VRKERKDMRLRRPVTATLLLVSTVVSIWIETSPSAGNLHYVFTQYDPKDRAIQVIFAGICIAISFGIGSLFKR